MIAILALVVLSVVGPGLVGAATIPGGLHNQGGNIANQGEGENSFNSCARGLINKNSFNSRF